MPKVRLPSRPRSWLILALAAVTVGALILPASAQPQGAQAQQEPTAATLRTVERADRADDVRNVILLVGDGMGSSELSQARYYEYGAEGRLVMDYFRTRTEATTWSVREDAPGQPDYVPDSASTATSWSTGEKTSDGRISTTAGTDQDIPTIMEMAEDAGLLTGNVSTARLTDATPAAPMAHVADRGCEGPEDTSGDCPQDAKENRGLGSIAEQSIDADIDVLLGGGNDKYSQTVAVGAESETVREQAERAGYEVVGDLEGLRDASPSGQVLGLFSEGHMPTERTGPAAVPGGVQALCAPNPDFVPGTPTVSEMTREAIRLLDAGSGPRGADGFYLQVEGASIDKQAHASNPCAQIGETVAFDRAVQAALNYAAAARDTLVIVTADHTHTPLIIPAGETNAPGATATLTTADGEPLQVVYATTTPGESQNHTGSTVPVFSAGPEYPQLTYLLDQTDLFDVMTGALDLP